jgi:uncharacterized membrane protein YfhO
MSLPQILSAGTVQVGDSIIVEIDCSSGSSGTTQIRAAVLNDDVFRKGYEILAASTLDLTEFSNTRVEGTINCNRDGLLYTSIAYDGNWKVYLDGDEVKPVLVGNCMMGLNVTEGTHSVRFVYRNDAFVYGCIISLLCATAFVALIVANRTPKKKTPAQHTSDEAEN